MDAAEIQRALNYVTDETVVFHAFTPRLRDYEVVVQLPPDPAVSLLPEHLAYTFTHCVRASVATAWRPEIWAMTMHERAAQADGLVWGTRWQVLYPGGTLLESSAEAAGWAARLRVPFHEVTLGMNAQTVTLVFSDLVVRRLEPGYVPFAVEA